jgi:hypothetical protein
MSWLARLLGRAPAAPTEAVSTVAIPADLAAQLTASGAPLSEAVEGLLREHLAEREAAAAAPANGDRDTFFWLARDADGGDIEERLRDRIAQRRAAEGEAER